LASLSRPVGSLADELAPAVVCFDRSGLAKDSSLVEIIAVAKVATGGKRDFGPGRRSSSALLDPPVTLLRMIAPAERDTGKN